MALDMELLGRIVADNRNAGVTWEAGATSMLELGPQERSRRLGYVPGPGEPNLGEREIIAARAHTAALHESTAGAVAPPASFSWTNVNGRTFISSIKDQGSCGSCVAFGAAATIDGTMRVTKNIAIGDVNAYALQDVSEAQLFYCGAEGQQGRTCATGWWPDGALQYATVTGVAPEACFPYTPGDQSCNLGFGWQSQLTQVGRSSTIHNVVAMKQFISTNGPLIACFSVYDDFFGYRSGVYRYNGTAPLAGGHCISVVGYDDTQQAWLCKNSWGTGWGMSGYFLIAYGQCGIDSTMWSVDAFARLQCGPYTLFSSSDMAQGPGAVQWLTADLNGDGQDEIIQMWANGGSLGCIVYGAAGSGLTTIFQSGDMGQGPDAVQWLVGDVNGDGKDEIVQQWSNGNTLGTIVYGWSNNALSTLWSSGDMGQGPDAVAWLIGDVNGDGKDEIIQQWANGGSLGTIVYGWVSGALSTIWSSADMGQGPGAVQWLIGDLNGDGKAEIIQQWANGGSLGSIVYAWSDNALSAIWQSNDMGQGPGAVKWLIGDLNGDGRAEVVQLWANGGSLGMIIYGWSNNALTTVWSLDNVGQGPGAVGWLIGDMNGDGRAEIVQQWANGGSLGTIIYGFVNGGITTLWSSDDMQEGPGAVSWMMAKVFGRKDIIQAWANGGSLGMIVYGYPATAAAETSLAGAMSYAPTTAQRGVPVGAQ